MTRQFCRENQAKNDHVLGKIHHCGLSCVLDYLLNVS